MPIQGAGRPFGHDSSRFFLILALALGNQGSETSVFAQNRGSDETIGQEGFILTTVCPIGIAVLSPLDGFGQKVLFEGSICPTILSPRLFWAKHPLIAYLLPKIFICIQSVWANKVFQDTVLPKILGFAVIQKR